VNQPAHGDRPWVRALVSTSAVTTACVFPAFLTAAMAVQIRRDLDFGEAGVGFAVAAFFGGGAVFSAPFGRLAERMGATRALRVAGLCVALDVLAVAVFARSLLVLCVLLVFGGAANSLCQPAANLAIARALPAHRLGVGFAVKQSAIPVASLLAGLVVPAIALTVGWEWGFVAAAVFGVVSVAALPHLDDGGAAPKRTKGDRSGDVPIAVMAILAASIGLGASAAGCLGSFLVSAAVDAGMKEGGAGLLLTAGSLAGVTVRLAAGVRADKRDGGHLRVVVMMLALGSVCFAVLATGSVAVYLIVTPLAFATGWAWPGLFNLAIVRANPGSPAAATGITQTGTYVGAVAGPLGFGFFASTWSYGVAWLMASAFAAGAAGLMLIGRARLRAWKATATSCVARG